MDYLPYLVIGLFIVFMFIKMGPAKGVRNITTMQLKEELKDKNKQLIDVRTPGEYKANHIRGFKNIPLHQIGQNATKELSKDQEVVVICQSGMRSQKACKELKKLGFTKITNVTGGVSAWS
ncbi:MAG TPA: rhodanese-like domain-containing protein [Bacillus sp. (in: firmicutes)]|uniref:rhodanese-like domain-containing protein n=1 Tax=Bacillus litorisediminis TaxID=2922713 RepID=UPI001FAEBC8C|nr:rhodanese-like domain-containing protein [Bacillus litorisediminis]HWO76818.1 rhodanese-like domain-containing protein [Bacillus sp. (in: firmicutes)]